MKISVIMPSYLESFTGACSNRSQLFIRAVDSFLNQSYKSAELIVISDGCEKTNHIVKTKYKKECLEKKIVLIEFSEHRGFMGVVRQSGISQANGNIISNLDSDDFLLPHHLKSIAVSFNTEKYDWIYWNYYVRPDNMKGMNVLVDVKPEIEKMNNACHCWRKGLDISWENCDGRQDNKLFLAKLIKFPKVKKIFGCGYIMTNVQMEKI